MNVEHHFMVGGNSCRGCGSNLAARLAVDAVWATTRDALIFGDGCGSGYTELPFTNGIGMESASLTGMETVMQLRGHPEKRMVLLTGEGRTFESGFDQFSAAIARQNRISFIIIDNQGFSSSGSHQTATTSLGARTPIHPDGKSTPAKNAALMTIFNGAKYVATASPAFPQDLQYKVAQAVMIQPSLVQIFCPCITTWGLDPQYTVRLSRLAATNGMFPIWEYKDGLFKRTVKPRQREHVGAYLELQRRYRGVSEEMVARIDAEADALYKLIERMESTFPG